MKRKCKISILFWQRKGRGTAEMSPVFCRITIAGQRYEITTNVTISHKNWSSKLQRSIGKTQEDREANRNLESVYDNVTETIERIQKKGYELNIPNFKLMYTNGQGEVKTLRSLFEYHKTMEGKKLSASTNRAYEITLSHLLNFIRITHKAHDYDITLVDKIFVNEFAAYLQGYRREDDKKRCEVNGALKHLKRLKKLMGMAFANDWIPKNPVSLSSFHPNKFERGFLTADEIHALQETQLSPSLSVVRDIFIFACFTGISYVDLYNLTGENISIGIDGSMWLYYHRQKTLQRVAVPLLEPALELIRKYEPYHENKKNSRIFPVPANQVVNRYLKIIASIAKINKHVTFHQARHTFATSVTLSQGIPIETVSRMLGHASIATTQIYAKIVDKKVMDDMSELRTKYALQVTKKKNSVQQ